MIFFGISTYRRNQQPGISLAPGQHADTVCRAGRNMQLSSSRRKSESFFRTNIWHPIRAFIYRFRARPTSSSWQTLTPEETTEDTSPPNMRKDLNTFTRLEIGVRAEVNTTRKGYFDQLGLKPGAIKKCHRNVDRALATRLPLAFEAAYSQNPAADFATLMSTSYTAALQSLEGADSAYPKGYLDTATMFSKGIVTQVLRNIAMAETPPNSTAGSSNNHTEELQGAPGPAIPSMDFSLAIKELKSATKKAFEALTGQYKEEIEKTAIQGEWPAKALQTYIDAYVSELGEYGVALSREGKLSTASIRASHDKALKSAKRIAADRGFVECEIYHADSAMFENILEKIGSAINREIDEEANKRFALAGPSKATAEKAALRLAVYEDALALSMMAVRKQHLASMPVKGRDAKKLHAAFDQRFMAELRVSLKIASKDASQDTTATHFWESAANACYAAQTTKISVLPAEYLAWMRPLLDTVVKQLGEDLHIPAQHRDSQSEWSYALRKRIIPGQMLNARQWVVRRHRIVEKRLQEAAGNFCKTENMPLSNLRQRRIQDANKLRDLAIQYLKELDWQHYYKDISPKIKSWIAFCCAQEEFDIEARNAVQADQSEPITPLSDADIEGLSNYRANMRPLLRLANREFASELQMPEDELNGWWDLEQAWIGWEETRTSTSDAPLHDFAKICAAIACASYVRSSNTREDSDVLIKSGAAAISRKKFSDYPPDKFMTSDFNLLPGFVTAILNEMDLQFPPQRL